jgi:hypothetical protein
LSAYGAFEVTPSKKYFVSSAMKSKKASQPSTLPQEGSISSSYEKKETLQKSEILRRQLVALKQKKATNEGRLEGLRSRGKKAAASRDKMWQKQDINGLILEAREELIQTRSVLQILAETKAASRVVQDMSAVKHLRRFSAKERSREVHLNELASLFDEAVDAATILGQNINAYPDLSKDAAAIEKSLKVFFGQMEDLQSRALKEVLEDAAHESDILVARLEFNQEVKKAQDRLDKAIGEHLEHSKEYTASYFARIRGCSATNIRQLYKKWPDPVSGKNNTFPIYDKDVAEGFLNWMLMYGRKERR